VINVGALAGFTLQAANATMKPSKLDGGNLIEGAETNSVGILYPGERVEIAISAISGVTGVALDIILDPEFVFSSCFRNY
jgi:hypothetical protein